MYIYKNQNEAESQDSQNGNDVRSGPKKNSHIPIIPRKRCNGIFIIYVSAFT